MNEQERDLKMAKEMAKALIDQNTGFEPDDVSWASLEEDIASQLSLARQQGRQEERKRCAAIVVDQSWLACSSILEKINTPCQGQNHDAEAPATA